MRVGFAGLGNIGALMAWRLHEVGLNLVVWNRSAAKAHAFRDAGVPVAASPADLARRVDILCLCVTDAAALDAVLFGPDGIVGADITPAVIVDHSTVSPDATRRIAERVRSNCGAAWVDAPVSGGLAGAAAGQLAVFVGGEDSTVAHAWPVLTALGASVTHLGPTGSGQIAKACNQVIGFLSFAALAEGLALGSRFGIAPRQLAQALTGGFADTPVLREWTRVVDGGAPLIGPALHTEAIMGHLCGTQLPPYDGPSPANLVKDLGIIAALAKDADLRLPLVEEMRALLTEMRAR
ncbi:NAD(P)-dependent oxidoreductase [Chachezhania sediminis]|uniref:NAD(P)-dependent oxidoreductase n=1 Tax=Chachezhania sediminis TaxID=2599291 RepID=UPI00131D5136|nr:NAD(P)-dependent oxidoreductase [Chachezhania sediminis]